MRYGGSVPSWAVWRRRLAEGSVDPADLSLDAPGLSDLLDDPVAGDLPVLRSLLQISQAVLRANYFDEALEVIAEQALVALNAASLSISRWERMDNTLRTLINVGHLGPGEERWPENERYPVAEDPDLAELLQSGRPYINSVDDSDADPVAVAVLRQFRKECELAVPVMYEDAMWGELWVSGVGGRHFGPDDVQLLEAIAAHVAVAIGRCELFSTVWQYAHQDPLTGLANRRALDQQFAETDWEAVGPALLVCDLDGFKEFNDRDGHPAGDALLRGVARVLADIAAPTEGSMVARLGGDEFCVVLPRAALPDAERFAREASRGIGDALGMSVTLSWGAAIFGPQVRSGLELMAAADAALLEAKRLGPGRFSAGVAGPRAVPRVSTRHPETAGRPTDCLVPHVVRLLDECRPTTAVEALEILAVQAHNVINAAGWSVSVTTDDGTGIRTHRGVHSARDQISGLAVLAKASNAVFPLIDYPATARALAENSAFIAAVDLDGSDPAEVELLNHLGYRAVLAVGVGAGDRRYLLELYSDVGHADLAAIAPHIRVLALYCATRGAS